MHIKEVYRNMFTLEKVDQILFFIEKNAVKGFIETSSTHWCGLSNSNKFTLKWISTEDRSHINRISSWDIHWHFEYFSLETTKYNYYFKSKVEITHSPYFIIFYFIWFSINTLCYSLNPVSQLALLVFVVFFWEK